ncbi:MAG: flagellar hook-length control protein FliK [Burkholderiales bacterium]
MDIATPAPTPSSAPLMPDGAPAAGSETTITFGDLLAGVLPGMQAPESAVPAGFSGDADEASGDGERLPDLQDDFLTGLADARASATPPGSGTMPAVPLVAAPALPVASTPAQTVAGDEPRSRTESAAAAIPAAPSTENPHATQNARAADTLSGTSAAPPATAPMPPFTQAPAQPQPAAAVAEQPVIEVPIRHAEWPGAFAQRVSWTVHEKLQSAQLILNPPELGPVEVRVTVDREEASLLFVAAQPAVRNAIEQALPVLRESLQQSGIQLGNTEISSGNPQHPPEDAPGQPAQGGSGRATSIPGPASIAAAGTMHQGLVDTYA